ncbi:MULTISPECIES: DNA polymerase beta superfamily protein [unclassified Microbacterium]|uniref:nucleotidyltransferase domain-containing protein n=1 Tax=unclassified Microbacterium TaxID=2609290 RepID=UPI002882F66A|nr:MULTISPECIES: nucleotidyltransferase domain-containing protein [unclassified Microbacterium]
MSSHTTIDGAVRSTGLNVAMLVEYGSRAYGTAGDASDRDLLGVYVEHDHEVYGLLSAETQIFRFGAGGTMTQMVSEKDPRSSEGDVEMIFHPLRKFVSLAAAGNPSVLGTLWSGPEHYLMRSAAARLLADHRHLFLSKHACFRHAGYARAQRDALLGRTNRRTNRPELILEHGYDSKYAGHLIRLLLAGLTLVRERTFHLPMKPEHVEQLLEIRRGEVNFDDVIAWSEKLEQELSDETEDSDLPDKVDYDAINDLLRDIRRAHLLR